MLKTRSARGAIGDQAASARASKAEVHLSNGSGQQTTAQAIRKRRSSINVYDQPSSLNSRLRQLETDMLRLDEDRTKLFDDTHSALAQYELRLGEIHAILKSRQDNAEKYVEDMKLLLQAKDEFEKQTRLLNEKHDRFHEKFTHRETIISRELKLLKNKFEVLEKNRQFRILLQKGPQSSMDGDNKDDLSCGIEGDGILNQTKRAETSIDSTATNEADGLLGDKRAPAGRKGKNVRIKMSKFGTVGGFFEGIFKNKLFGQRKSNRVSSLKGQNNISTDNTGATGETTTNNELSEELQNTHQVTSASKTNGGFFKRLFKGKR